MPLLETAGSGSAKGFGLFGKVANKLWAGAPSSASIVARAKL